MKYTPRELADNVNVSVTHPLKELVWMVGGLVAIVVIVSLAFWLISEWVVPRVPVDVEVWAGKKLMGQVSGTQNQELTGILHRLLKALPPDSPLRRYNFSVRVADSKEVNAVALPGGRIVVFSGLLVQARSENELAMVLGHELGHYAHRDHLRALGRGLGVTLAMAMMFGKDSQAASLASDMFHGMEMRYSQKQEQAADAFGLDLLEAGYGHVGGATDLFSRLTGKAGSKYSYVLASHPHPEARISALRAMIAAKGYPVRATIALRGRSTEKKK